MDIESKIGPVIRELRTARQLTLNALSSLTGLSVSHISQIERGVTSPSLSSLRQISNALDIRLSQLILAAEPTSLSADRFVSRKEDRTTAYFLGTRIAYELISREGSSMQLLWVSAPSGEHMEHHKRTAGGEETAFVISGQMRIQIEGSEALLGPGDVVFIESMLKHGWENVGPDELVLVWTMIPPTTQKVLLEEVTTGEITEREQ